MVIKHSRRVAALWLNMRRLLKGTDLRALFINITDLPEHNNFTHSSQDAGVIYTSKSRVQHMFWKWKQRRKGWKVGGHEQEREEKKWGMHRGDRMAWAYRPFGHLKEEKSWISPKIYMVCEEVCGQPWPTECFLLPSLSQTSVLCVWDSVWPDMTARSADMPA